MYLIVVYHLNSLVGVLVLSLNALRIICTDREYLYAFAPAFEPANFSSSF